MKRAKTAEPHGPAEINFQKQKLLVSTYRAKHRHRIFFEKQKEQHILPDLLLTLIIKISIRKIKTYNTIGMFNKKPAILTNGRIVITKLTNLPNQF